MPRSPRSTLTRVAGAALAVGLGLALTGCGGDDAGGGTTDGGGGEGGEALKIALLLPES